ncbi:hypothetical protein Tco_1013477 [Tanacetum coccineum]
MTTLAEHIIVVGAKNRPPMLEKSMYDSWASHIRLFIKGKKYGRMMLDSIDNDDCDVQASNIILHGLPPDVYAHVNHQEAAKDIWDKVKLLMKGIELSYQECECRLYNLFDKFSSTQVRYNNSTLEFPPIGLSPVVPTFQQEKIRLTCINKAMALYLLWHLRLPPSTQSTSETSSNPVTSTIQEESSRNMHTTKSPRMLQGLRNKLMLAEAQSLVSILDEAKTSILIKTHGIERSSSSLAYHPSNSAFQTEEFRMLYDSIGDDISSAKAVLMANLSSCDSEVLSKVPYSDTYLNDMLNQDVQENIRF